MPLELTALGVFRNPSTGEEKEIEVMTGLVGSAEETLTDAIRWQFEQDAKEMRWVPVRLSYLTARTHNPVRYPK